MQLDLFRTDDVNFLCEEYKKVKESSDKVRRGIFARHDKLEKLLEEQQKEIDALKSEVRLLRSLNLSLEMVG